MSHHVIHFYGSISHASSNQFRITLLDLIAHKNAKKITVFFSSDGGDLNSGFTTYNLIRSLPIPISMYNMGTVESIAVLIYLAAEERFTLGTSRFLFHSLHWGFNQGVVDHQRLVEHGVSLDYDLKRYVDIFNDRTKGAQSPIDIRKCLDGHALILGAAAAHSAAVVTAKMPTELTITTKDTFHWWITDF